MDESWSLMIGVALFVILYWGMRYYMKTLARKVPFVTLDEANAAMKDKNVLIIDVRTQAEYEAGHIPGALLIPLNSLPDQLNQIPKDKKVYIVCRSSHRSVQAVKFLMSQGFTNVFNVLTGMVGWSGPLERGRR